MDFIASPSELSVKELLSLGRLSVSKASDGKTNTLNSSEFIGLRLRLSTHCRLKLKSGVEPNAGMPENAEMIGYAKLAAI